MQFEDLAVWKRSHSLAVFVYKLFSNNKDFGFKDQITRSALSVPSNIAEGYERFSNKDKIKFLFYSKASCAELRAQVYIGVDIGYISQADGQFLINETSAISRMLQGLIKALR
jgi:four helix bundle protein